MYLKFSDEDVVYTQIAYNQTKKGFTLVSETGAGLQFMYGHTAWTVNNLCNLLVFFSGSANQKSVT